MMTPEQINIIKAWISGEYVQFSLDNGYSWTTLSGPSSSNGLPAFNWVRYDYRIKPTPVVLHLKDDVDVWADEKQDELVNVPVVVTVTDGVVTDIKLAEES